MKVLSRTGGNRAPLRLLVCLIFVLLSNAFGANIGTIVPVVGQVSDLVYDTQRGLVYLANISESVVNIYSVGSKGLIGQIPTGQSPSALAISPDSSKLYVANSGSLTVSVIDLTSQQPIATYTVSTRPDSIAVGSDGLVLILGPAGLIRLDPSTGISTPLAISVPAVPPGLAPGAPTAVPAAFRAGMVASPSGSLIVGLSTSRLFVYDVASGTVLRSRNVTGLLAILSISPDGSRFMCGPFLFDTQTMAILGRSGTPSATLSGGSAFSVDGNSVYATFSTQPAVNPLNPNNPQNAGGATLPPGGAARSPLAATLGVLQVLRASSLTPLMGLRLAEPINPKIVASPDGQNLFAISTSGLTVIPIGQLNQLPVIGVDTPNLVLSVNICNQNIVSAQVQVQNLGAGRLTFTATLNNSSAPVIVQQAAGLAPSALQITFNPRSVSTQGTQQFAVVLVSPEAVNIEPVILVNVNYRNANQIGTIIPINGVAVDQVMDSTRQQLYLANYTMDQVEIFSLASQTFLPPIRVGNRPLSMTMVGASTLVVANSGAETLTVIDLDRLQVTQTITMGPIPLNATPLFPHSIAASSNAVLFSAVPLAATLGAAPGAGSVWQLSLPTQSAFPRLNLGTGVTNSIAGVNRLIAPASGSAIVSFESVTGNGNLRLYDPIADTFPVARTGAVTGFRGTTAAAADGSFFVMDDYVFNSVLSFQGTMTPAPVTGAPSGSAQVATFGAAAAGTNAVRVQPADSTSPVQRLQLINLSTLAATQTFYLPESAMDISPSTATSTATLTRLWPPNAVGLEIGVRGSTQLLTHGVLVDGANNAYVLSLSGLSIVPMVAAQGQTPRFSASGVLNGASFTNGVAPGSLFSIFGTNLAGSGTAASLPLPTNMGGVCVTANGLAVPLVYTSPTQINAQLPPTLAAGKVTLAVLSTALGQVSSGVQVTIPSTAPGIFSGNLLGDGRNWAQLYHAEDYSLVTPSNPGNRDHYLILYATGLGSVSPVVPAGQAAGSTPVSATAVLPSVFIGGHQYPVESAVLAPGFVGVYQINILVPGDRLNGTLPVVITVGSVSSSTTNAPLTTIQ